MVNSYRETILFYKDKSYNDRFEPVTQQKNVVSYQMVYNRNLNLGFRKLVGVNLQEGVNYPFIELLLGTKMTVELKT